MSDDRRPTLIYGGLSCGARTARAGWVHIAVDDNRPLPQHLPAAASAAATTFYITNTSRPARLIDCRSFSVNFSPTLEAGRLIVHKGRRGGEWKGKVERREEGWAAMAAAAAAAEAEVGVGAIGQSWRVQRLVIGQSLCQLSCVATTSLNSLDATAAKRAKFINSRLFGDLSSVHRVGQCC